MNDPTILIANERCKQWATNLTRLGSGLLAYVAADIYLSQEVTLGVLLPLGAGIALAWLGWLFLGLLQSEK